MKRKLEEFDPSFVSALQQAMAEGFPSLETKYGLNSESLMTEILPLFLQLAQSVCGNLEAQYFYRKLPNTAPVRYRDHFRRLRDEYRAAHHPEIGGANDYSVVTFFQQHWGPFIKAGVISSRYLDIVDPELYRALIDHVRSCQKGRHNRQPVTLDELGVHPIRAVLDNTLGTLKPGFGLGSR